MKPPVLLYHAVLPRQAGQDRESAGLVVEPSRFEWQMADLARRGFRTLALDGFAATLTGRDPRGRSVLLTFDDAYAHLDQTVTPILLRYGFTAVLFAAWETLGRPNTWDPGTAVEGLDVASPSQLSAMAAGPWEVACHGLRHVDLRGLPSDQLKSELARSRDLLSELLGRPVLDLAYPYGHQSEDVREAARQAGFRMAFTVHGGDARDRFRLGRQMVNGEAGRVLFRASSEPYLIPGLELARRALPEPALRSIRAGLRQLRIIVPPPPAPPPASPGAPPNLRGRRAKRFLDVVGAGLLLTVCTPLMAAVSAAVRLDSPGPVIYRARRIGQDGRPFTLFKFRTMCADAEQRLAALSARNLGGPRLIRIPDDPRVTRLGRPLRRTGLDELPQLVNVLRGEMSLVGPRPQAPDEVEYYNAHERQRLSVPPGITGLWQIRAWSSPSFDDWVRYDIEYIRTRSIWLDLRILAETPLALGRRFIGGRAAGTAAVRSPHLTEAEVGDARR